MIYMNIKSWYAQNYQPTFNKPYYICTYAYTVRMFAYMCKYFILFVHTCILFTLIIWKNISDSERLKVLNVLSWHYYCIYNLLQFFGVSNDWTEPLFFT